MKGFVVGYLNIRSLIKNIDELRIHLSNQKYDILSINETMLDSSISNNEINISGYDVVRKDRNRNGGGVALYIRNVIDYKIRDDLMNEKLETITIQVCPPKGKSFFINTWYRPPDASIECFDWYENCIRDMDLENKETILIGDFNCDWSRLNKNVTSHTARMATLASTYQFEQMIKEPTRITATSRTLIDLAFCNKPELITMTGVDHLGISDHSLIYVCRKISISRNEPKIIRSRQFKHYDKNSFLTELRAILQHMTNDNNPDVLWEDFKTKFLLVADVHAPQITRKVKSEYTPWMTNNIKKQIYHREFLKKKAIKTGSENMFVAYKKSRNTLNKLIKDTKMNYYTRALNDAKNNPKNMWNTTNKLTNKKSKTTTITRLNISNENVTDDPNVISHTFNTYFNTIGQNLANELPGTTETPESYVTPSNSTFQIQSVSEVEVFHSLITLKISKASEHDKIPPKLLKDSAIVIAPILTHILNQSINTGIFPKDLKTAIISPLYKSGSKTECCNYRPISVLSTVAKILEKLISVQLYEYLENNAIIASDQFGFRKKFSTKTAMLSVTNKWLIKWIGDF